MLSSLKKWVQDVAVDLTPPTPPQPSTSSPALLSSLKPGATGHQYYSGTSTHEPQHYSDKLPKSRPTNMGLTRPVSMDSVRTTKLFNPSIPPLPASPVELDLSHLNREEQEHIANVLRRARAVDEQPSIPSVFAPLKQSPPTSIVSASLSSLASSSSSNSTNSFNSEKQRKSEQDDQNNINDHATEIFIMNDVSRHANSSQHSTINRHEDRKVPSPSPIPEPPIMNIYRCQVCNKQQQQQQQQGNMPICLQCRNNEENSRFIPNNIILTMSTKEPPSAIPIEFNKHEDDTIYDNVTQIDEELTKQESLISDNIQNLNHYDTKLMNDHQGQEKADDEDIQQRQSPVIELKSTLTSSALPLPMKTRTNNLTEIDEDDFYYQGPSTYVATIDNNIVSDQIQESPTPTYKIDEYVEDDDNYERDHVKELEETIANLSRHFPVSSPQVNNNDMNSKVTNLQQPSTLSVDNIDIDSILEMEIESPSSNERYIQSSSTIHPISMSSQHPLHIPIAVPISVNNRRGTLSRSSGVREHLTDLLVTTKKSTETYPSDTRSLPRNVSGRSKRTIPIHRQKRNLPSVPQNVDNLQLRRTNSESRFSLPAVESAIVTSNSNFDDENDLLEIDLNDPTGSMNRTSRSKTESEIIHNDNDYDIHPSRKTFHTTNQTSSIDRRSFSRTQVKELKDQTTNTPPLSNLNSSIKPKKKLKKKGSSSPSHSNSYYSSSTYINGHMTPTAMSPTSVNPPSIVLPTSSSSSATTTSTTNRPKLQKSTSTEISYPFPVSKLILSRDSRNVSQRNSNDLGLRITGGHSIANCMDVTARIERISKNHRNYNILKNAVQEGDEVLEVGGVSLRGKSALFVQNLMDSIQDEFEIVVRSQHTTLPSSSLTKVKKVQSNESNNNVSDLTNSLLTVDQNALRRHSMDTPQHSSSNQTNSSVLKSHSTTIALQTNEPDGESNRLLTSNTSQKKSVSSKEHLFSVDSLHRTASTKSVERFMRVATSPNNVKSDSTDTYNIPEQQRSQSMKRYEQKPISLSVTTPDYKSVNEDLASPVQPSPPRRMYEHRNSLLPNDPGLNGAGSSPSIDRRNSNESDESDNLSQYFRSPASRKNSLVITNEASNTSNTDLSYGNKQSTTIDDDNSKAIDASNRLQSFIKSSDDQRRSRASTGGNLIDDNKKDEKKSLSNLGSFKFLKKKTKSVDFSNHLPEIRANDYVGDIELQIGHNSEREQLVIRIIKAKNLLAKDTNGYSDPFVKVYLLPGRDQENKRRTKHVSRNLNPVWDHTVVYGNMHREELQYKMLEFTLWDYDRFKANDFLGQVTIDLKDSQIIDDKPHWYRLQALRSREEATNRGSTPRLFKMTSVDTSANDINKNTVNSQSRVDQRK